MEGLVLNGVERGLHFSKWRFNKILEECLKVDPLLGTNQKSNHELAVAIIYSGMCCHCHEIKQEIDFSLAEVSDWVLDCDKAVVEKAIETYNKTNEKPGESQTQA